MQRSRRESRWTTGTSLSRRGTLSLTRTISCTFEKLRELDIGPQGKREALLTAIRRRAPVRHITVFDEMGHKTEEVYSRHTFDARGHVVMCQLLPAQEAVRLVGGWDELEDGGIYLSGSSIMHSVAAKECGRAFQVEVIKNKVSDIVLNAFRAVHPGATPTFKAHQGGQLVNNKREAKQHVDQILVAEKSFMVLQVAEVVNLRLCNQLEQTVRFIKEAVADGSPHELASQLKGKELHAAMGGAKFDEQHREDILAMARERGWAVYVLDDAQAGNATAIIAP